MLRNSLYHKTQKDLAKEEQEILAAKRNREKFGVLYQRYYEQIYRYIFQRVDTEELAGDITSQVFINAMLKLEGYEYRGVPFSSWLYRIAKNELNLWFRKKKADRTVSLDTSNLMHMMTELDEESTGRSEQEIEQLVGGLNHLEWEEVEMIEMRYFEKRPFKEIGEILEITENNAKVRLYRILDKLKKVISKEFTHGKV